MIRLELKRNDKTWRAWLPQLGLLSRFTPFVICVLGALAGEARAETPVVFPPAFTPGDSFSFWSSRGTFMNKYKGLEKGNHVFKTNKGREYIVTQEINTVAITGSRRFFPHSGWLKFPLKVGSS